MITSPSPKKYRVLDGRQGWTPIENFQEKVMLNRNPVPSRYEFYLNGSELSKSNANVSDKFGCANKTYNTKLGEIKSNQVDETTLLESENSIHNSQIVQEHKEQVNCHLKDETCNTELLNELLSSNHGVESEQENNSFYESDAVSENKKSNKERYEELLNKENQIQYQSTEELHDEPLCTMPDVELNYGEEEQFEQYQIEEEQLLLSEFDKESDSSYLRESIASCHQVSSAAFDVSKSRIERENERIIQEKIYENVNALLNSERLQGGCETYEKRRSFSLNRSQALSEMQRSVLKV